MMRSMASALLPSLARSALAQANMLRHFADAPNQMALIKELREKTQAPIADVKVRCIRCSTAR